MANLCLDRDVYALSLRTTPTLSAGIHLVRIIQNNEDENPRLFVEIGCE